MAYSLPTPYNPATFHASQIFPSSGQSTLTHSRFSTVPFSTQWQSFNADGTFSNYSQLNQSVQYWNIPSQPHFMSPVVPVPLFHTHFRTLLQICLDRLSQAVEKLLQRLGLPLLLSHAPIPLWLKNTISRCEALQQMEQLK